MSLIPFAPFSGDDVGIGEVSAACRVLRGLRGLHALIALKWNFFFRRVELKDVVPHFE